MSSDAEQSQNVLKYRAYSRYYETPTDVLSYSHHHSAHGKRYTVRALRGGRGGRSTLYIPLLGTRG